MRKWLTFIILSLVLIIVIRSFIITTYVIEGKSMEPYFHSGDRVVVNLLEDVFFPLRSKDIIFFRLNDHDTFVKRIIAAPGDYIAVHHSQVFVNGEQVTKRPADYSSLLKVEGMKEQIVPEKCYIVLGDNLADSIDSREYGCVNEYYILGKVINTYWHKTTN
ncbi:signal peptidase I [Macrococcus equipercicus]|uniref:Signal peptidase I n=1 Tax=Macrococcus equipercicus TaxID=69967 RepID=A0A9Q9F3P5_9STAP|nr:signal peptidase I [Macrococcus equipercicus]KAA1042569.1 signal peptidase I [Macrococcus equipercicus]UTH14429.1 signal peptidase I [Macrococcus equipercicus]